MRMRTYIRESADAMPHAVPRTFVPKISGVHLRGVQPLSTAKPMRKSDTYPYNTVHIVYPIRESVNVTKNT